MRALAKLKAQPGIWMTEAPQPTYGPHEVLIKVKKTAICGTDIHIYKWDEWAQKTIPVPMIVGHEFSGVVEAVGEAVVGFKPGDRVSGEGHVVCWRCRNCRGGSPHLCPNTIGVGVNRQGCFAEYLVIPATNAYHLPDSVSDSLGAILDPFGNATHTALSFELIGEDVLITGAGPIGVMAVAIAKYAGARRVVITDVNEYRLQLAKEMGATHALNVQQESLPDLMKRIGITEGFGVGMEMSGNPMAFRDLLKAMSSGGKVALLGIPPKDTAIDWNDIIFKGLFIKGIYGREMFETWYKMISMLDSGLTLSPIITHEFSVDDFQEGFDLMSAGQSGKIVLQWD